MRVLATEIGFILQFEDITNLKKVIKDLQGQVEWAELNEIDAPYLYLTYAEEVPIEKAQELLESLKKIEFDPD